jgi:hypothetical protein
VLVDLEEDAVESAARLLRVPDTRELAGDLTDPELLARVGEVLLSLGDAPVVTCFEVVEHLASFVPLLEWSNMLVREHGVTFVLSVPNDAFWAIQNPHHLTVWSEGSFEELRQLIPAEHTLMRQIALSGSATLGWEAGVQEAELKVAVGGEGTVATHFIVAFGPRHGKMQAAAVVAQTNTVEQRRWERQRESDVAVAQQVAAAERAVVKAQDLTIAKQKEELRAQTLEFDAWRTYIRELEGELGRPLSGSSASNGPAEAPVDDHPEGSGSKDVGERTA